MFMEPLYVPGAARHSHDLISLSQQALESGGVILLCTEEETEAQQG